MGPRDRENKLLAQHFLDCHCDGGVDTALVQVTGTVLVGVLAFSDEEVQTDQDVALCLQQLTAGVQASCVGSGFGEDVDELINSGTCVPLHGALCDVLIAQEAFFVAVIQIPLSSLSHVLVGLIAPFNSQMENSNSGSNQVEVLFHDLLGSEGAARSGVTLLAGVGDTNVASILCGQSDSVPAAQNVTGAAGETGQSVGVIHVDGLDVSQGQADGLQEREFPVDQVLCRGYDAARACVDYLHQLGHRAICYLGETVDEQRYQAFLDSMHAAGVEHPEYLAVDAPFSPAGGYSAVHQLLEGGKEFTAILCANDMLAVGAMKALRERRLRIPKDVSLIGINDMETSRYLDPMLTTVAIPMREMGKHAAKILIDRIQGGHTAPVKLIVPSTLICRESCAAAKEP